MAILRDAVSDYQRGAGSGDAQTFPKGFVDTPVLSGLTEPATLVFAPDGRLFVGERITQHGGVRFPSKPASSFSGSVSVQ